jgi:hypothetical protein
LQLLKYTRNTFRFSWLINENKVAENEVEIVYLASNRCVSRFKNAKAGKYTIVAETELESTKSSGYIEVTGNLFCKFLIGLNFRRQNQRTFTIFVASKKQSWK